MGQQQQQQSSGDTSLAPVWLTALLFFALFFLWKGAHAYIVSFLFSLNVAQAHMVSLFVHDEALQQAIVLMKTTDPASVDWNQLVMLTTQVGNYIRYPVMVFALTLAVLLYRSDITRKFHKTYTMKTLSEQEKSNWPSIVPVLNLDLSHQDINVGPWAMALTPVEFAKKNNLMKKNDFLGDDVLPGQEMTAGIRRGDAKRVFTLQLGPAWAGFGRCSAHVRALAAVFLSRMNRDKDTASAILRRLDQHFSTGKFDDSQVNGVILQYQNDEKTQEILQKHAYLLTVMASLLEASRDDGVVPSAEFLWLKTVDRRLWYMLNSVGRQTPFVEVSGPFAHWRAEKAMGHRFVAPMIDEAIKALEIAVKEKKLSPNEMKELTS